MSWIPILILVGVVLAFIMLQKRGQISAADAVAHLKQGAKVIDVRNPGEFASGHLPQALNIPLGDLKDRASIDIPDKQQVLLLHCVSGMRSAMGARTLKSLGYTRAFNLGSYARAEHIVLKSKAP